MVQECLGLFLGFVTFTSNYKGQAVLHWNGLGYIARGKYNGHFLDIDFLVHQVFTAWNLAYGELARKGVSGLVKLYISNSSPEFEILFCTIHAMCFISLHSPRYPIRFAQGFFQGNFQRWRSLMRAARHTADAGGGQKRSKSLR